MVKLGQRGSLCGSWRSSEGSQGVKRDVFGAVGHIGVKKGVLGVLGDQRGRQGRQGGRHRVCGSPGGVLGGDLIGCAGMSGWSQG